MLLNFNALTVEPATGSATKFPLDDYLCEISKVEAKPLKDNPAKGMLVITLKVLEGSFKGATQDYRLNLFHDNETTVRIAYAQLAAITLVTGKGGLTDSAELVGGKLIATIGPQDNNDQYSEVKKVMDVQGGAPVKGKPFVATAAGVPVTSAAPVPTGGPAWTAQVNAPTPDAVPVAAAPAATTAAQPAWATPAAADDKPSWMK